ncbi:SDR family NAD(P)-dependent oxidoreductase [Actinocrispum wychmicini]|uniref:Meso-butanediol dehydrogenase/(S,S)-butanediol dehydrogenase/diacetyl reductase n=1 Tax=Actinocrispum wychmicini TaxID=1213861 RepID=A0A4R2J991_9PSEU|nr:SDR family oxidoreductase [Actinocrispum wychmicini]TCO54352.1 meso-butanediol dehydrogenase/(S,S)-butanediol dehydrogenase/diacetyl reductase [Actinocrispum wychmicini]
MRLDGKVALVTGATSGIGTAIASRLAEEGAQVLLTGRSATHGTQLARRLPGSRFHAADLLREDAADELVASCVAAYGRIDVLVNNAAVDHTGDLVSTPTTEVRETFEVNTFATLRLMQAAGRRMMGTGGSIVNITSRLASVGVPTMGVYSASKGAVLALTRAAAVELAPYHIRVNAVAPGMTRTPLYQAWLDRLPDPAAAERDVLARIPLGRLASPEDIAAAVSYLASDDAAYITGASLPLDGGYTAQ